MQVLVILIENQGQVLSRNDIFDQVWKNQVISDDTLTRCISDLRSQLKALALNQKLIETIPKRGYRWLPAVSTQPPNPIVELTATKKTSQLMVWLISLVLSLALLTFLFIDGVNEFSSGQQIRVALLPIYSTNIELAAITELFEDILKRKLLATKNIRFLSSRIIDNHQQNLYPRLSREFSIQWVVEVKLRSSSNKLRISLNLVDARTAIVYDSISSDFDPNQQNFDPLIDQFILLLTENSD